LQTKYAGNATRLTGCLDRENSGKLEHEFYITLWKSIPNEEASGQYYFRGRRGVSGFLEQINEK
jgi:hypothetical protein